jgi:hypothetical protein
VASTASCVPSRIGAWRLSTSRLWGHDSGLRRCHPPVQEMKAQHCAPHRLEGHGRTLCCLHGRTATASASPSRRWTAACPSITSDTLSRSRTTGAYSICPKLGCGDGRAGRAGNSVRGSVAARHRPLFASTYLMVPTVTVSLPKPDLQLSSLPQSPPLPHADPREASVHPQRDPALLDVGAEGALFFSRSHRYHWPPPFPNPVVVVVAHKEEGEENDNENKKEDEDKTCMLLTSFSTACGGQ